MKEWKSRRFSRRARRYSCADEKKLRERVRYISDHVQTNRVLMSKALDHDSTDFYMLAALVEGYQKELKFLRRELILTLRLKHRGKPTGVRGVGGTVKLGRLRVLVSN